MVHVNSLGSLLSTCYFSGVCLPANDLLEDSPYEAVNSRLSDIFRLAPIISGKPDDHLSPPHTYLSVHIEYKSFACFVLSVCLMCLICLRYMCVSSTLPCSWDMLIWLWIKVSAEWINLCLNVCWLMNGPPALVIYKSVLCNGC